MQHVFLLTVETERESGKFASADEIAEAIIAAIDEANPGQIDGIGADSESVYTIETFEAEEISKKRVAAVRAAMVTPNRKGN